MKVDSVRMVTNITPLSPRDDDYFELLDAKVAEQTDKALRVNDYWYPKSQMRIGTDYKLYITKWLFERLMP